MITLILLPQPTYEYTTPIHLCRQLTSKAPRTRGMRLNVEQDDNIFSFTFLRLHIVIQTVNIVTINYSIRYKVKSI